MTSPVAVAPQPRLFQVLVLGSHHSASYRHGDVNMRSQRGARMKRCDALLDCHGLFLEPRTCLHHVGSREAHARAATAAGFGGSR